MYLSQFTCLTLFLVVEVGFSQEASRVRYTQYANEIAEKDTGYYKAIQDNERCN